MTTTLLARVTVVSRCAMTIVVRARAGGVEAWDPAALERLWISRATSSLLSREPRSLRGPSPRRVLGFTR
jgi:hypothetical protein